MPINRRTLLQWIPATALAGTIAAQTDHCGMPIGAKDSGPYKFQFFTPDEITLVDKLMELIIPADDHSPGAHDARTVEFADLMVSSSEAYVKNDWRAALALIREPIQKNGAAEWLARVSQNEDDPQTVEEIFFRTLKQMTINGYYSSAIGIHNDLQYQGNTYVQKFEGCTHPEHQG
ncbi:MAG TPA: gluconate 2-dehydrogenase subunit 3 family protein [Bryobacteraceae bacterium]|jgi:hypothetical protein|nr:gluconate 2-dehydrogenase subunit 3 family protein [Bryobacteraceae bacterium]